MDYNNEPPKIVFEGEQFQQTTRSFETPTPKIVRWVIKCSGGTVKDERQANYVLIGFVVVAIIFTFILLFSGGKNVSQKPSDVFLKQVQKMQQIPVNQ